MKIQVNRMSLIERLDTAAYLVDRCTARIDIGTILNHDEINAAECLRIICREYLESYNNYIGRISS